jgi:4-amino-4-deoxy-L-arabinose transferase-like glycosyltransferase
VALWIGKPPLFMWLLSLAFQVFGATNFAARFWSPIFAALALVTVYFLGKTLYNRYVGFGSALVLGSFSTFYVFARLAMTDMSFLFFVLASLYFAIKHQKTSSSRHVLFCGVFFGLALMTKQVVALIVPLLILLYLFSTQKSFKPLFSRQFALRFWGVALLIFLPWVIFMAVSYGVEFLNWFFVFSDVSRATGALEGHSGGFFYYCGYLGSAEWWWAALLPFAAALSAFKAVFRRSRSDLFVLSWMLLVLAAFSLIQTKLEWYILPVFPAFALAISSLIYQVGSYGSMKLRRAKNRFGCL